MAEPTVAFENIEDLEKFAAEKAGSDVSKVGEKREPSIQDLAGEGEWLTLRDGNKYLILPLLMDDLRKFYALSQEIAKAEVSGNPLVRVERVVEVAYLVLSQAYPNVTREQIEKIVSLKTVFRMIEIVMNVTGVNLIAGNLMRLSQGGSIEGEQANP
jgi:hypothetical protein